MTDPDNLASKSVEDRMPEELSLAGDFPKVTHEQWEEAVLKVLNRGRPEGKELNIEQGMKRLEPTTVDGIQIEPMYRRQDAPEKLGVPGVPPFTRGTTIREGGMHGMSGPFMRIPMSRSLKRPSSPTLSVA